MTILPYPDKRVIREIVDALEQSFYRGAIKRMFFDSFVILTLMACQEFHKTNSDTGDDEWSHVLAKFVANQKPNRNKQCQ